MNTRIYHYAAGALVALALTSYTARAGDTNLVGNTLLVGVNNGGSISQDTQAGPTPTSPFIGIQYDKTGTGNYSLGYDFITPGDPYQYFSVGADGQWASNSYNYGNNLGMTTTNTSSGTTLQATSTGGMVNGLGVSQTLTFQQSGAGSGVISFTTTLTNTTDSTLSNIAYSTGLDPDQDNYFDGTYATSNTIVSPDFIYATGSGTAWTIGIKNTSDYTPSGTFIVDGSWDYGYSGGVVSGTSSDQSPYLTTYGSTYGALSGPGNIYGDYTINMAWNLGDLGAGKSTTLTYDYVVAATPGAAGAPAPDTGSTLALLGLALAGLGAFRRKLKV